MHRHMPGEPWTFCGRRGRETAIWWEPPSTSTLESGSAGVRVGSCGKYGVMMRYGHRKVKMKYRGAVFLSA